MKLTVLCENYVITKESLIAEHGWSVFIETDLGNYLFDTGQGLGIVNNASYFHKDLSTIEGIILSHSHYDHTGGLMKVIERTGRINVYSHPELFKLSYDVKSDGSKNYIGIPFCKEMLENKGCDFIYNTKPNTICRDIVLSGEIPRTNDFEEGDVSIYALKDGNLQRDTFLDDQTLYINTDEGLVVVLGCSHAGIVNVLNHAVETMNNDHIRAVIGGTHLARASKPTLEKSIGHLKRFNIDRIGVSHCTGFDASMRLQKEFGDKFFFCNVGEVMDF